MTITEAIAGRRSVRAFLPAPVPQALVADILAVAARAPSGSNLQPWKAWVLTGEAKADLSRELVEAHQGDESHQEEYDYYPRTWREPFLSRRRKVGFDLYRLLGIARGDKAAMKHQLGRNYVFFDAPVGLIFTIERDLPIGSWLDYGTFLQNVMLAARGAGLETCPQQAFAKFHRIIRRRLDIPESQIVVCGMALGYEDRSAAINLLKTERIPIDEFVTFLGHEPSQEQPSRAALPRRQP